jgi:hypothetical protein
VKLTVWATWGDFLATTIRSTSTYSDYNMDEWAANRVDSIRNYVQSLNETFNSSAYTTLDCPGCCAEIVVLTINQTSLSLGCTLVCPEFQTLASHHSTILFSFHNTFFDI